MRLRRAISTGIVAGLLLGSADAQKAKSGHRKLRVEEAVDSVSPQVAAAESALGKNDFAKAEELLKLASTQTPNDYHVWYDLGFLYRATKRPESAADSFAKAAALKPDIFEIQFEWGMTLASLSRNEEAAAALRAATKLKPTVQKSAGLYDAWLALGRVLKEKHPAESVEAFQQASTLHPDDLSPILESGEAYAAAGKPEEAAAAFSRVLELQPSNAHAMDLLIQVLIHSGHADEAEARLRERLVANPEDGESNLQLGRLLLAGKKPEDAAFYLEAAQKSFPARKEISLWLATSYRAAKRWGDLSALLKSQIVADDRSPVMIVTYGDSLMHEFKYAEAQNAFLQAVSLDPKSVDAFSGLAFAANGTKQYPLVLKALDARAGLTPEIPTTLFLRAVAYDNLRMKDQAIDAYHRFLDAAAGGPLADQIWQAQQRLQALEGESGKKKKK